MTDQDKIAAGYAVMAEAYGRTMSPGALAMLADDLNDLTYPEFVEACRLHRRGTRSAFFPQPGELLEALRGDSHDAATDALAVLQGAIRDLGWNRPPKFHDPLIQRCVIALGGWADVCKMDAEMLIPHFRKAYEPMHRAGRTAELAQTGGYLPAATPQAEPRQIGEGLAKLISFNEEAA